MKITEGPRSDSGSRTYQFEDRKSREVFSFGEEEYFLCQSLDGRSTAKEVLSRFSNRFGVEMSEDHFRDFQDHLLSLGLADPGGGPDEDVERIEPPKPKKFHVNPRWSLFNPEKIFDALHVVFGPMRPFLLILNWVLVAAVPVVIYLMIRHAEQFYIEIRSTKIAMGYIGGILFGLLAGNFVRCLIQGVVCSHYHVTPTEFGIKLRRLIFPRFFIDKSEVRKLSRHSKLWIFGTSILVRLYFIAVGGIIWALYKDSHSLLPAFGVVIVQSGFIGLFLQLIPFDITDGYRWIVNFFHLPPTMIFLATKVFLDRIRFRPLPSSLSGKAGWIYLFYGAILIIGLPFGLYTFSMRMAEGFSETFPNLFGRATVSVFFVIFLIILLIWFRRLATHPRGMVEADEGDDVEEFEPLLGKAEAKKETTWEAIKRHKWLAALAALAIILCLPTPFRPGGEIQILPPAQQQVQAPVSGKISQVFFEGGDGHLIKKGTVIAKMTSSEIENQILTLEQTRAQQEASLEKARSELAKLVAGARKEEVDAASANLDKTEEQINIASQELASAKVASAYSTMVLPRMKKLYDSGSIAYLQYEEAKKTADIEAINVQKAEKNLAALRKNRDESKSQLQLLQSGARGEDVDSARHTVEASQAEVARVSQQIQYYKGEDAKSALLMPFDGYLVDSHLHFKEGVYLSVGQNYATAQNNSDPQVEVQLPEYDIEGIQAGDSATVKLFAYPSAPFEGKVTTVQPAALPGSEENKETITRLFRVLIKTDNPPVTLKAGMTGYAKIQAGVHPLGLLLARPIIRFINVEMWSWLP
jgi:putative peptide zinc metalloprotease protein